MALPTLPDAKPARPQPLQLTPAALGNEATLSADESGALDAALRRQLRSLQFLVRHGVYNEGFSQGSVPEQYRQSQGIDDLDTSGDNE